MLDSDFEKLVGKYDLDSGHLEYIVKERSTMTTITLYCSELNPCLHFTIVYSCDMDSSYQHYGFVFMSCFLDILIFCKHPL